MRKIDSLPEAQVYQVLDYLEFLESKYAPEDLAKQVTGFQRLAEGLEDGLRKRAFNPSKLREAFQLIAAADRALNGVARAGRQILEEITEGGKGGEGDPKRSSGAEAERGQEVDPMSHRGRAGDPGSR